MNEFLELIYNEPEKIVVAYFKDREGNPMQLAHYQTDVIKKLIKRECDRFIVVAATQSGKSETLSVLLSLFALFYPNEQIVNVSATEEQARIIFERVKAHLVEDNPMIRQLVDMNRSLGASKEFSKRRMFMKNGTEIRILATGRGETENVGAGLLGFSASILTVDEAALIPSDVFTTKVLRMLGAKRKSGLKKMLILSSTPQNANWFEDAWNDPAYQRYKIDWKMAVEAGRMDINTVMEQKRKMTRTQFCSWYEAEFPSMTEDSVFDMEEVNRNTIPQDTNFYGEKILSVDIARFGADYTIFLLLDKTDAGYRVVDILSDEKKDLMHTVGRIVDLNKKHVFDKIIVDEAGLGGGCLDRLKEQSISVIGVIAGSKCTTETMSDVCLNLKAELYMKAKKLFETDRLKIIDKGQLKNELRKMKKEFQSTGKIRIIDPEEKSPDYASALVYGLHEAIKGSFVMVGLGHAEKGVTGFGGK